MSVSSVVDASNSKPDSQTSQSSTSALANKNTFLQLLVAQLQHQDPLSPADSMQFVTQLAQFTSLEQSTQMSTDISAIRTILESQQAAGSSSTDGSAGQTN